ncbi:MAG: 2-succinyl-6-hydroxy-2,4-cyclohexadiene-1-carboxylate synthase [Candidatus Promineifilaceae bacterium]|nr:2-succinyl-6-hydroxy-2,4-cyclohexadiene-1-carboxylate synthase [Candidatus Promineifilaceae bacterium]
MSHIIVNGLNYHFDVRGAGTPFVLLHGFTGSSESWTETIELFAGQFQTVAIDLPGHGLTAAPDEPRRYSMPVVAADLTLLLNQLGIKNSILLGYSMGGRLALYLALNQPDFFHTLILESASPGLISNDRRRQRVHQDEQLARYIESNGVPAFVEHWQQLPLFSSQSDLPVTILKKQRNQRLKNSAIGLANSLRGMGTGSQPSLWTELPMLQARTLLLVGALDRKFTDINERMAEQIPFVLLQKISNSGHNIHLENPQLYSDTILSFIRS